MGRRFLFCTVILTIILLLTGCNSNPQSDSILKPILSEFEEVGITLKEKKGKSETFSFAGSDEKQYEFSDGSIYLIYNFSDKDKIVEKLTELFAEAEFPYDVNKLYTDEFFIIFVANSGDLDIWGNVESIFEKIKDI